MKEMINEKAIKAAHVLRSIYPLIMLDTVTKPRKWRKLHNEEINDLYSSPIFVRVIKSRRMRWADM